MNKKQKLLVGLCVPAATLASAGGVIGILAAVNHSVADKKLKNGEYQVTFDCGKNAHFVNDLNKTTIVQKGTRMSNVKQPTVVSNVSNKVFAGWVDENGKMVDAKTPINRNTRLTATYNEITGNYVLITFTTNSQDERLFGNLSVAVKKGYAFLMVNRPTAEAENKTFNGWKHYNSSTGQWEILSDSAIIESNITLKPDFTSSVNVHWNTWCPGQVTEEEGEIVRGQANTRMTVGTKFKDFNQPQLANGDKFFQGWADYNGTAIDGETAVTADMQAYALWGDPVAPESYTVIHFDTNPTLQEAGLTPQFAPQKYLMVPTYGKGTPAATTTWADVNTPTVSDSTNNWKISTHEEEVEGVTVDVEDWLYYDTTSSSWQVLSRSKQITESELTVSPVLVPAIDSIDIIGNNFTYDVESTNTIYTDITGTATGTGWSATTWGIYDDEACTTATSDPITIKADSEYPQNGILSIQSIHDYGKSYWVKVTSTLSTKGGTTTTKTDKQQIYVNLPFQNSSDYWFYNDPTKECSGVAGDGKWYKFKQAELSDTGTTLTAYGTDGETTITVDKTATFSQDLYIGTKIKIIQNNFMANFSGFTGNLMLNHSTCNVTQIESSFMEGCTSFNQILDLSNITSIGSAFLNGCTGYSQALALSSKLTTIGDDFLGGCSNFNAAITFGDSPSITTIGQSFLYACTSFNQNITFPATLTSVGAYCMYRCDAYVSTITMNADPDAIFGDEKQNFCAMTSDKAIATTGYKVEGTYADAFKTKYPTYKKNLAYRNINEDASKITYAQWTHAIANLGTATTIGTDTNAVDIQIMMPNLWGDKAYVSKNGTNIYENDIYYAPVTATGTITGVSDSILEMRNTKKELEGYASVTNNSKFYYGKMLQFMSDYGMFADLTSTYDTKVTVSGAKGYHKYDCSDFKTGYYLMVAFGETDKSGYPLITEISVYDATSDEPTGDSILFSYKSSTADDYTMTSAVTYSEYVGAMTKFGQVNTLTSTVDETMNGWVVNAKDFLYEGYTELTKMLVVVNDATEDTPITLDQISVQLFDPSTNTMSSVTVSLFETNPHKTFVFSIPSDWATKDYYYCISMYWAWSQATSTPKVNMLLTA